MKVGDIVRPCLILLFTVLIAVIMSTQNGENERRGMASTDKGAIAPTAGSSNTNKYGSSDAEEVAKAESTNTRVESRVQLTILRWDGKPSSEGECEVYTKEPQKAGSKDETYKYKDGMCEFTCTAEYARVVIIPRGYKSEYERVQVDPDCGPVFLDIYPKYEKTIVQTISLPRAFTIVCVVTDVSGKPLEDVSVYLVRRGPPVKEYLGGDRTGIDSVGTFGDTDENGEVEFYSVLPGSVILVSEWIPLQPNLGPVSPFTHGPDKCKVVETKRYIYPTRDGEIIRIELPFDISDYPYYMGKPYKSEEKNPDESDH